ncbi:MAG: sugar kinase [Chthoniobacterales bacterium]
MATLAAFGEILLRLNPPGYQRISQAGSFEFSVAGAEANVAVACASLGHQTYFLSVVPENEVASTALRHLNFWHVNTDRVILAGRRLGLYYLENGFAARPSNVIYDRENSAISEADPTIYDWSKLLAGCDWFHTSGITAALSEVATRATAAGLRHAHEAGLRTSFDMNYRRKLWSPQHARAAIESMLPTIDLLVSSPDQLSDIFGLGSVGGEEAESAEQLAAEAVRRLPIRSLAMTLRKTENERHYRAAVWADAEKTVRTPWLRCDILERIGGGDAFSGGLISALMEGQSGEEAAIFGVAAACLKHTIPGDFIKMTREEINAIARQEKSRGVAR